MGTDWQTFHANVASALDASAGTLVPSTDPTVVAGYKAIYNATVQLMGTPVGQVELLLSLTGATSSTDKIIAIQAALQHPFRCVPMLRRSSRTPSQRLTSRL